MTISRTSIGFSLLSNSSLAMSFDLDSNAPPMNQVSSPVKGAII